MKYTIEFYGWEMEAQGYSVTNDQVEDIIELMDENAADELWEVRSELEDVGIDVWDEGDLFHISKPLYNGTLWAKVMDAEGNTVLEFEEKDTGDLYDHIGDDEEIDEKFPYENYVALPEFLDTTDNVLLIVDENKGGLMVCTFESDEVPTAKDFSLQGGTVETPDGDWDFVSRVFFKDQELEAEDYLDSRGKAASLEIYTHDGRTIS